MHCYWVTDSASHSNLAGKCAGAPLKTGKPHVKPDPIHQHGASVSTIVIAGVSVAVLLLIALSVLGLVK